MKQFDLNIEKILENWEPHHAIREIIANALDEQIITNTKDIEIFKEGVDETIQFQLGFPGGAIASCLSSYNINYLDRIFLSGEKGFAEMQPSTNYGPIMGKTHKGELTHPHVAHQTVQMEEMAGIILKGKQPIVAVDGNEALKDLKIIDAIYLAVKTGKKVALKV